MRKIREALRLHHDAGLGVRAVSRSLKASPSTVREYLVRAKLQGLSWPLPESLDDTRLLRRLYPLPAQSPSLPLRRPEAADVAFRGMSPGGAIR